MSPAGVFNVFAAAALESADGAFLLGQMAPFTAAAGRWVFPSGTPAPDDINSAGMLDLTGNVAPRIVRGDRHRHRCCQVEPGWTLVRDGGSVA